MVKKIQKKKILILLRSLYWQDRSFTEGIFFIYFCLVSKKNCPVSKKKKLRQFAYQNTYNEAIFDLWPKRRKQELQEVLKFPIKIFWN